MPHNLIIFIKNPVLGTVKTRLAHGIGSKNALIVYKDLLENCRLETTKVDSNRYLFYSQEVQKDEWSEDLFIKRLQEEGDLGERIIGAFHSVFKNKEEKTLIIGSDCYDLKASIIEAAFKKLDDADLVIGPANDGGYYLLGTKKFYPLLFEGISWSTSEVFNQTVGQAKRLGLSTAVLQELIDIDTLDDLKKSSYEITYVL